MQGEKSLTYRIAHLSIERTVRGNAEVMQFALENPTENITVNDTVKIAYISQGGKLVAARVANVNSKKKEVKPVGETIDVGWKQIGVLRYSKCAFGVPQYPDLFRPTWISPRPV